MMEARMRRLLVGLIGQLLLLLPALATAQGFLRYHWAPGGSPGGAGSFPLMGGTGCTAPEYSFTADTNAGTCLVAANQVAVQTAASGGTRSLLLLDSTNSIASLRFYDAAEGISGFEAADDLATIFTNGLGRLVLTTTLGSFLNLDTVAIGSSSAKDPIYITPVALGAASFAGTITSADLTAARTWTFGNASGTVLFSPGAGFPADTDGAGTMAARTITAGTGISVANGAGAAGNPTISMDTAVTPQYSSGTASASATGAIGTWYHETDAGLVSTYSNTDTLATMMSTQTHFIDEDSFATDSATKAPSQQSVKAYSTSVLFASFNGATQFATTTTQYCLPIGQAGAAAANCHATEVRYRAMPIPRACTLKNLYVFTQHDSTQPASGSMVLTLFTGSAASMSASSVAVTVEANGAGGVRSDTSNTVAVSAGDLIAMRVVNNASAGSAFVTGWSFLCQ